MLLNFNLYFIVRGTTARNTYRPSMSPSISSVLSSHPRPRDNNVPLMRLYHIVGSGAINRFCAAKSVSLCERLGEFDDWDERTSFAGDGGCS